MPKRLKLRTKMLILSFILVSSSVLASGWMMLYSISSTFEQEIGERAIAIARTVAQMDDVKQHVGQGGGEETIQPVAERIRLATNVDYIVILDMHGIRYSHPSESRIGERFVGGDEHAAFSELEYTSKAEGTLGYAIRAFVPIMDQEGLNQVGVAVVGILAPTFQSLVIQYQNNVLFSLLWGLLIGLCGSWLLATNIKKQAYNLEPYEIARLLEERSAVMEALDIGIIALDGEGQVSFMNHRAEQYTGRQRTDQKPLPDVLGQNGSGLWEGRHQKIVNKPFNLKGTMYLLSSYPIYVNDQFVGSLITLKNRSEAQQLAEELTGIKSLVSALRAQNHEYMNKLHSIAGLIQLERTEEALQFMIDETSDEETIVQFLKDYFKHDAISGLLLGKRSRAKEMGVQLHIAEDSYLTQIIDNYRPADLVTIVGNLIDNALEACQSVELKHVTCLIQGDIDHLYIRVQDTGIGMSETEKEKIFEYGYSSKAREGRGIGLALVKQLVEANNGSIRVQSAPGIGTTIEIRIVRQHAEGTIISEVESESKVNTKKRRVMPLD